MGIGLNENALQIKKAYKALASIYHPDKNQDGDSTSEVFLEIQEAYDILKNSDRRKVYTTKLLMEYPHFSTKKTEKVYLSPIEKLQELLHEYILEIHIEEKKKGLHIDLINLLTIQFAFAIEQSIKKDSGSDLVDLIAELARKLRPKDSIDFLNTLNRKMEIDILRIPHLAIVQHQNNRLIIWQKIKPLAIMLIAICICLILYLLSNK